MSASVSHSVARSSVLGQRIVDQRPVAAAGGAGVGGNTVAQLLQENCADMRASAGVVIEYLDTQAGTWQFSLDDGQTWRAVRTDARVSRDSGTPSPPSMPAACPCTVTPRH